MIVEVEIEEGDIVKFNDEVWEVVGSPHASTSLDMESQRGTFDNFDSGEMERQIHMAGRFSVIKESYVDMF